MNADNISFYKNLLKLKQNSNRFFETGLHLSFNDRFYEEIPELRHIETRDEHTTVETLTMPSLVFYRGENEQEHSSIYVMARESTRVRIDGVEDVDSRSVVYYTLLTAQEQKFYKAAYGKKIAGENLDEDEEEIVAAIERYPLSEQYSMLLEKYIMGSSPQPCHTFIDYIFPVVETERCTILKHNVATFLLQKSDWTLHLSNPKQKYRTGEDGDDKIPQLLYDDIKQTINNYFRITYNTLSIISAARRGDKITTPELYKSSYPRVKEGTDFYANRYMIPSILNAKVPIFNQEFMETTLMGFVPLFLIFREAINDVNKEFDVLSKLKLAILNNIEVAKMEVLKTLDKDSDTYRILANEVTATKDIIMGELYPNGSRAVNANAKLVGGNYNCVFVDYLLYVEVLRREGIADVRDMRALYFLNTVSPIEIDYEIYQERE